MLPTIANIVQSKDQFFCTTLKMTGIAAFCFLMTMCSLQTGTNAETEVLPQYTEKHTAGITYEAIEVFQSYPVNRHNTDQSWKVFSSCNDLSGFRETFHAYSGQYVKTVKKPCHSVLKNCRHDKSMNRIVRFCLSKDKHRRYDYMEINMDPKQIHGRNVTKKCTTSEYETYYSHGRYYPCLCDCESSEREAARYFSLQEVVADDGKVVVGVRLRKIDHVFYIQIQQVQLGWERLIRGKARWKEVKKISKSDLLSAEVSEYYKQEDNPDNLLRFHKNDLVYAVTGDQNTVFLDNLMGEPHEVLTGLRFRQKCHDLRFEIQVTPFDDMTATLDKNASRWLRNDADKSRRLEVTLLSSKIPNRQEGMNYLSFSNQFIKFQVSDFETDLGQTTVPFIDMRNVTLKSPRALSGAGIFHRGTIDSAGFIALKLIHL